MRKPSGPGEQSRGEKLERTKKRNDRGNPGKSLDEKPVFWQETKLGLKDAVAELILEGAYARNSKVWCWKPWRVSGVMGNFWDKLE